MKKLLAILLVVLILPASVLAEETVTANACTEEQKAQLAKLFAAHLTFA